VLNPEDPLVRWATFGRQVEDFLDGPIGQHLLSKARQQAQDAVDKLKIADPEDAKAIRALQNQAQVADSILGWLGDVIHEGQGALEALKEDHDGN
jgi:hypothetical protein